MPMIPALRLLASCVVASATLVATTTATAQVPPPSSRPWGIGVEVGLVEVPHGHLGIPVEGDQSGYHLPAAIAVRYQLDTESGLNFGLGLPHAALGAGAWVGYERFTRLVADTHAAAVLEIYAAPGMQLGFAGPDYFVREYGVYVGHEYAFGGPATLALRFPMGVRVSFAQSLFDTYVEAVPLLLLTPSVDVLFQLTLGLRVRFSS